MCESAGIEPGTRKGGYGICVGPPDVCDSAEIEPGTMKGGYA